MSSIEKYKIINSFMGFMSASSVCGFIFYCMAQGERFERYQPLVVGFGLIYFIGSIITLFIILKCQSILNYKTTDEHGNLVLEGLKSGNHLGLIGLSILNIILFNPFYPVPSFFENDTYDGIYNDAYSFMGAILIISSYIYYTSKQQIKIINT